MSIDANANANTDTDCHDSTHDDDDNVPSSAECSGGWIQFAIAVGRLCKSDSLECLTWSTSSMTTFVNDTVTSSGNNDRIFESVVKSSRGNQWEFRHRGQ